MTAQKILIDFEDSDRRLQRFLFRLFNRKRSLTSIAKDNAFTKQLRLRYSTKPLIHS